jgi:nitrogen PTS system EIIA component
VRIEEFLKPEAVILQLAAQSKPEVLRELSRTLAKANPAVSPDKVGEALFAREKIYSTGIGEGVAIPHGKLTGLPGLSASFGVARAGIDFDSIDKKPTYLFFALVSPENSAGLHLKALARISRLFKNPSFREAILQADTVEAIYALITQEDARV